MLPLGPLLLEMAIPQTATQPIVADLTLEANVTYTFVVSGTYTITYHDVQTDTDITRNDDALYCYASTDSRYCNPPSKFNDLGFAPVGDNIFLGIDGFAGKQDQIPYEADHSYEVEVTKPQSTQFHVASFTGSNGNCAQAGTTCSGEMQLQVYGPEPNKEVRFLFTQAGRTKGLPDTVVDAATAGSGFVVFRLDSNSDYDIVEISGKVVRDIDYLERDPDSDFKIDERRVRLKPIDTAAFSVQTDSDGERLSVALEMVGSSDPDCKKLMKDGTPRRGELAIKDGGSSHPDAGRLKIEGCPQHTFSFRSKDKKKVKVVITYP